MNMYQYLEVLMRYAAPSPAHLLNLRHLQKKYTLECGPVPNVMAALPNTGGALCSTPQSLADTHY